MRILKRGGSALDAVEACARIVEDDPSDHSVGTGGWPNVLGEVELDASIMDGRTRRAGAVCALRDYPAAISIARKVMEKLPHLLLAGEGAARFAREMGFEPKPLLTDEARELWRARLRRAKETPESVARRRTLSRLVWKTAGLDFGTVNFLALDRRGELASAVSTSGWAYKYPGRVGDSSIIGAGNYCDSRYGAAACTGFGELPMRGLTARTAVEYLRRGAAAAEAARLALAELNALPARHEKRINVVVLTPEGEHAAATTRRGVQYAVMTGGMRAPRLLPRVLVRARVS